MDINNLRERIHYNQIPKSCLRDNLVTSDSFMRGMQIKTEPQEFDCKTKKRKHFNVVGLDEETMETCSSVKQEFTNFQHEDGEYDLGEPFFSRKSKLLKNIKSGDEDLQQLNQVSPALVDVKLEVPETTNMHILKADVPYPTKEPQCSSPSQVSYEYMENFETELDVEVSRCEILQVDSSQMVKEPEICSLNQVSYEYREIFETKFDEGVSSWETVGVHSPEMIKEPQYCSVNGVSDEYMEDFETNFDVGVSTWEILQVHSPETISNEYLDLSGYMKEDYTIHPLPYNVSSERMSPTEDYSCDACASCQNEPPKREVPWQPNCYSSIQTSKTTIGSRMETGVSFCPIKCGVSNGVSSESTEDVPKFGPMFSGCETVKVDSPKMISYQSSDLQEIGKKSCTIYPLAYVVPSESVSPTKDHCSDTHDSLKCNSSAHKMASQNSNYGRGKVPEMDSGNCFQCLKNNNEDSACSVESRTTHDRSSNIRNIGLSPSDNGLSQMKHKHRAERFHSSRKVISPTSRARLCQAMGLPRLDENKCHHCRGELYFGKQINHRTLSAQGADQFLRDGVTLEPKSTMNRTKLDKKESLTKGILNVTHPSQCRSQSVIAFTKRQMQDFESLTMKLTTELKSMKDLFKQKFHSKSEDSAATCAKENAEEVSVAIENATRAEGTAIRRLRMLARDSKRFCKIMRSNEDKTAVPERVVKKERKVCFADEVGGKLCHAQEF